MSWQVSWSLYLCVYLVIGLFVFTGGGVEPESHYPQWKRVHQNIERYPALNDSIAKLTEGTESTCWCMCSSFNTNEAIDFANSLKRDWICSIPSHAMPCHSMPWHTILLSHFAVNFGKKLKIGKRSYKNNCETSASNVCQNKGAFQKLYMCLLFPCMMEVDQRVVELLRYFHRTGSSKKTA